MPRTGYYLSELELIQSHMIQKPVFRGKVDARALRVYVRSWVGGSGKCGKCNALGCWRSKVSVAVDGRLRMAGLIFRSAPLRGCSARHRWSGVEILRGVSVPLQVAAVHDFI